MSWHVDIGSPGRVRHLAHPRFEASWTSGVDALIAPGDGQDAGWLDVGGGGEDTIRIYAITWTDPALDGDALARLMQEAAVAIEARILDSM